MDSTKKRIIMAAMKGVRQYGLEGVRIQNISRLAGLSTGAMYRYFESKNMLMRECFFYVDRQAAELFDHLELDWQALSPDPMGTIKKLWILYFRFWTTHPDETVFYHRFRDSSYFPEFDRKRNVSYFESFIGIVQVFYTTFPKLKEINPDLLWLHILTTTIMYAKYVVEGVLPDNEETEDSIFQLLTRGLSEYLKPEQSVQFQQKGDEETAKELQNGDKPNSRTDHQNQ